MLNVQVVVLLDSSRSMSPALEFLETDEFSGRL